MNGHEGDAHYKGFWTINVGHLLVAVPMLVGMVFYFATDHQMLATLVSNQKELAAKVQDMDIHGTQFSQSGLLIDKDHINNIDQRVARNTTYIMEFLPKLERMSVQIDNLSDWSKKQNAK